MLTRALSEAVTYPPSLAMLSSDPTEEGVSFRGVGSSILGCSVVNELSIPLSDIDQDMTMFVSNTSDVDMSLA